jgi:hypothetical protein
LFFGLRTPFLLDFLTVLAGKNIFEEIFHMDSGCPRAQIEKTSVINAGPRGVLFELAGGK